MVILQSWFPDSKKSIWAFGNNTVISWPQQNLLGTLERPWSCGHQLLYCKATSWCGLSIYSTQHDLSLCCDCQCLWSALWSALWSLSKLQRDFLLLCPFLPSTGSTSLVLLPVLMLQNLSTWKWNTAFWRTRRIQLKKSLPLPVHEALNAHSAEGSAFSQFAAGCSVLYCWTPRDSIPDTTTLFVQRRSSLELFSKATGEPLWKALRWACRQLLEWQEWKEALPQKMENSIFLSLSLFLEVSSLTVASLIYYMQVAPMLSGNLESADLVFMWCLHTFLIT